MKKLLHMFLVMIMLVVPVLSHAMQCNMSMSMSQNDTAPSLRDTTMNQGPCPNHKKPSSLPCKGAMSVADCLDTDIIAISDTVNFKFSKIDNIPIAILPSEPFVQISLNLQIPRAPPLLHSLDIPNPSIIILTQRFRI